MDWSERESGEEKAEAVGTVGLADVDSQCSNKGMCCLLLFHLHRKCLLLRMALT